MFSVTLPCLLLYMWVIAVEALSPTDDNVCQVTKTFLEEYNTRTKEAERLKTYTWCFGIPPRCTKFITKYKLINKKSMRVKLREEYVCCNGYKEVEGNCIAVCSNGCEHGVCIAPEICDCYSGWRGTTCNSECQVGTWGDNCKQTCQCKNEGICHVSTGQCSCKPGFYGPSCQYRCPDGTFGRHCIQKCKCAEGQGQCDPITGRCQCLAGYRGPLCEKECPVGSHGMNCESDCQCQNGGRCDPVDGACICLQGWTGAVCANPCEAGWYGTQCLSQCYCYNGGTCHHISGKCSCAVGYTGSKCQVQCPYGRYGKECAEKCLCQNNAGCDPMDGTCTCAAGFMGPLCSYKVCAEGWYGPTCKSRCHCNASTSTCNPWGGQCYCNPGYVGLTCDQACDVGWYGVNCTEECDCKPEEMCNNIHGCVAASTNAAVGSSEKSSVREVYIGLFAAVFLILLILVSLCLALYYRRRYKRLKQTTNLMVQYRVVSTDTPQTPTSAIEEGATGTSSFVDDSNPAHRHFSTGSRKKEKQGLMQELRTEETGEQEVEEIGGAAALPVYIPEEAPPPYTPTAHGHPYQPDNEPATQDLPPPYSPGHTAGEHHRGQRRAQYNHGEMSGDCDESLQNARNISRETTPIL